MCIYTSGLRSIGGCFFFSPFLVLSSRSRVYTYTYIADLFSPIEIFGAKVLAVEKAVWHIISRGNLF